MLTAISQIMNGLPVLSRERNPQLAAALGFVLGGIALGIYFRSFIDFILPLGIAIATIVAFGDSGLWGGAVIAALYGYFRALNSNERRGSRPNPDDLTRRDPRDDF